MSDSSQSEWCPGCLSRERGTRMIIVNARPAPARCADKWHEPETRGCDCGGSGVLMDEQAPQDAPRRDHHLSRPWKVGDRVHHHELPMYGTIERIEGDGGFDHFVLWDNGARCNFDAHELRGQPNK